MFEFGEAPPQQHRTAAQFLLSPEPLTDSTPPVNSVAESSCGTEAIQQNIKSTYYTVIMIL